MADLHTRDSDGGVTCKRRTIRPNLGGEWKVEGGGGGGGGEGE